MSKNRISQGKIVQIIHKETVKIMKNKIDNMEEIIEQEIDNLGVVSYHKKHSVNNPDTNNVHIEEYDVLRGVIQ